MMTHCVGRPLAVRNSALQRAEADFRTCLMRVRLFAEDIALQHGEAAESSAAARCFENVKAATWLAARGSLHLSAFTSAYGLAGGVVPFLILMPSYFQGHMTLGMMFQIEALVQGVRSSLDFFIGAYSDIAVWQAAASRLLALEDCVSELPQDAMSTSVSSPLHMENKSVITPGGVVLLENVSFEWGCGDRIVLCGPSGSGKSTLLRMLAGSGSRTAPCLPKDGVLLVSTSGFLLPHCATLRQCLAYPEAIAAVDDDLEEALARCGLDALIHRLDCYEDWESVLTLSDRQRLVFTRLISRWPSGVNWLLLDEVDGALDGHSALALHEELTVHLPRHVGIIVASRHHGVIQRPGWRCFRQIGRAHV